MAPKRKPVQKTLGAFGFTKKVFHREKFTQVEIPDEPKEEFKLKCEHCSKHFKNAQGLRAHLKCMHFSNEEAEKSNEVVLASASKKRKLLDELKSIEYEVGFVLNSLVDKVT